MKRSRKNLVLTLLITFVLMTLLVLFTARVIFRTAFSSAQELGDDKTTAITADLENYLDTAKSVLWLAADTVDHMVEKGASDEEIIEYITRESAHTEEQFDESYTGIYGVIRGNYVDGVGWVPPEDYDPTKREWYQITTGGKGEVVIIPPYVDAQTGNVIISIGKALTDNRNALALDLTLNGVQEIVEKIQINGYGYGFILDHNGMVIAHHDKGENGKYYNEDSKYQELFQEVLKVGKGNFDLRLDGEKCTVFVDDVMDQWHLVVVTKNSELYQAPMSLLFVSILINLIVFILISVFYIVGYLSERKANIRMEKLKEVERKKSYEAKILKLEKTAADSANKAKSNFLADMSHEIRTPINAILGMNEMILHESKEEETLEYASNIKSAGNTLLSIINTILDFSKIEDGRMGLVPAEFDTVEMINGLVNSISERAKEKNLEFKLDIDETLPSRLMGDDVRISQVIMNLLTNAVKYTEKGQVTLSIRNLGERDGKYHLLVSVKDTGIGIRKEDMNKLAISFERLDEQRNRHIEGTGLGIAIVTRLLIMMESRLKLTSEYGVGSEFSFELPIEAVDMTPIGAFDEKRRAVPQTVESDVLISVPEARILLTDDNAMNCKVAVNLMKLFNVRPTVCNSGRETIEKMEKGEYDLLFLDHMMPEMDGVETLGTLVRAGLVKNTKVIALTANAVVGAREQYLNVGFDDYLSKPIKLKDLEKILRRYLPAEMIVELKKEEPGDSGKAEETVETPKGPSADSVDETPEQAAGKKDAPAEIISEEISEDSSEEASELTSENTVEIGAPEPAVSKSGAPFDELRKLGLSVEDGLTFCGADEDFYLEIIHDYVEEAPERIGRLSDFLKEGNLNDYKILVHTVKSASKTIGAMDLYEQALGLERAAADGKQDVVERDHEAVMKAYGDLAEQLGNVV